MSPNINQINELTLSYIFLMQQLLLEDKAVGMLRFNLSEDEAECILSLSTRELHKCILKKKITIRPRIYSSDAVSNITENKKIPGLENIHLSMHLIHNEN